MAFFVLRGRTVLRPGLPERIGVRKDGDQDDCAPHGFGAVGQDNRLARRYQKLVTGPDPEGGPALGGLSPVAHFERRPGGPDDSPDADVPGGPEAQGVPSRRHEAALHLAPRVLEARVTCRVVFHGEQERPTLGGAVKVRRGGRRSDDSCVFALQSGIGRGLEMV